jgi:hypothetical protein
MARLGPVPATGRVYIHKDLTNSPHVFLRQASTCRALEPPYSGPYQVFSRKYKTLNLLVNGKPITVSFDKVKPAYIINEESSGNTVSKAAATATPATAPSQIPTPPSTTKTTCSGHHVDFPVRFTS